MAGELPGGFGRDPAAARSLVALVDALPGELGDRFSCWRAIADVEPRGDGDEAHLALLPLDLEEAGSTRSSASLSQRSISATRRDLRQLRVAVSTCIASIRDQLVDRPRLD